MEYLEWILDQGCSLGLDRYPGRLVSPYMRMVTLKPLWIEAMRNGSARRIVVSLPTALEDLYVLWCTRGCLPQGVTLFLLLPCLLLRGIRLTWDSVGF